MEDFEGGEKDPLIPRPRGAISTAQQDTCCEPRRCVSSYPRGQDQGHQAGMEIIRVLARLLALQTLGHGRAVACGCLWVPRVAWLAPPQLLETRLGDGEASRPAPPA